MKKYIVFILLVFASLVSVAQSQPSGFPNQYNGGWQRWGYQQSDLGTIIATRDTNWTPAFCGTVVLWPRIGVDTTLWMWNCLKWVQIRNGGVAWGTITGTLSNQTDLQSALNAKLNISDTNQMLSPYLRKIDTTNKWVSVLRRLVDTIYRVNDSTVGYTINGTPYTFQILGSAVGGGGSGGVSSVALTMPSAFSVSGSPITTSGVISVSAAGTSLQYIRGNGTLATFDTTAIPNFFSKVRGLFSSTSPIQYSNGVFSILNANTSGQKGAASFNSSHFSDNGSGTISLSTLGSAGSCTGCVLNIDAQGRIVGYSSGSGGATNNVNIGLGLRAVNQGTQEMRTYFSGFGTRIDSVSNSNGLTWSADTTRNSGLPTYFYTDSAILASVPDSTYLDSVMNSNPLSARSIAGLYNSGLIVVGNSISQGGASPYRTYADFFSDIIQGPYNNYSIGGSSVESIGEMLRDNQLPFNRTQLSLYNNGINDIRYTKNEGMKQLIGHVVRSFLVNSFKGRTVDAADMSVVAGSWASYNALSTTTTSKTNCLVTTDSLAELAFTVNDNRPGLFISFLTNGVNSTSNWTDSVAIYRSAGAARIATISLNKKSSDRNMPYVLWLPNTDVLNSIRIRNLTSDTLIVDYAGTTKLNNMCAPAMIAEITKIPPSALQPGIGYEWWDTVNAHIRKVVNDEFVKYGYPVATIDVNNGMKYDSVYFYELPTLPANAIHPSTYAHFNVILPQMLKKITMRDYEKKVVEYATNVSTYTAQVSYMGQEKLIILPNISQNSGLNCAADSNSVAIGQRLTIINNNSNPFTWSTVFWNYKEPSGTNGSLFPNRSVTELQFTSEGYRVMNRYGIDSVYKEGDTIRLVIEGRRFAIKDSVGSASALTNTYVAYGNASNEMTGEAAFNYDASTNKLGVDTVAVTRTSLGHLFPISGNTVGVRSRGTNTIGLALQSNTGTNLLSFSSDASANATVASTTGQLTVSAASGTPLILSSTGAVSLRVDPASRVSINESAPTYRFHVYENLTGQTSSTRAGFFLNQAQHNTTSGSFMSAGIWADNQGTRTSGGNSLINYGVYGRAMGAQENYGGVFETNSSSTNAIVPAIRLIANSTGTAANGFGPSLQFLGENGSATQVTNASIEIPYTDVTASSEDADMVFKTIRAGSLTEGMRLTSLGNFLVGTTTDNGFRLNVSGKSAFSDTAALTARFSYNTNIGSTFADHSLVDKHYVDSAVAAGGGGGGLSGSGTSGQIALWNGSSSFTGNSNILWGTSNGPRISIGTTNTQGVLNLGGDKELMSSGIQSYFAPATYTDFITEASSTASSYVINYIAPPTIAASNTGVTFPSVTTLTVDPPTAGTNATITNSYAFTTGLNGHARIQGNTEVSGALMAGGAQYNGITTITSDATLATNLYWIEVDASSGNITITLPAASSVYTNARGITYMLARVDNSGNTVTVQRAGSDTIGSAGTSFTLNTLDEVKGVQCVGTNKWRVY